MSTRRLVYLEPPPPPAGAEWRIFGRVILVCWLAAHVFVDAYAVLCWLSGAP
jgi:hypothetical protein